MAIYTPPMALNSRVTGLAIAGIVAAAVVSTGFPTGLQARVARGGAIVTSSPNFNGDQILATRDGVELFTFSRDTQTASRCSGRCARAWVPLITRAAPRAAAGSHVRQRLLGTIRRADGRLQVAYNHKLLYLPTRYSKACPGSTQFGGTFAPVNVRGRPSDTYCGPY